MLGCCSGLALATAAQAQSAEGARIEEVVVTAQRVEQKIQSVPVAITAFDRSAIEKHNIANIEDVQFHAPNVRVREEPALGGLTVAIRGISVSADNFSFDPAVGVYVNDVFIARANDFGAAFYDVTSVQVLRGPQGTLFGRDTPVGALLIDTKRPGTTYGGYIQAGVGGGGHGVGKGADRTMYRFEGAVDLPVSPILGVRLAGYYVNDDGWARSRATGYKNFRKDDTAGRATFEFRPADDFEAALILDHSKTNEGSPLWVPLRLVGNAPQGYDLVNGGTASRDAITALINSPNPYFNNSIFTNEKNTSTSSSATLHMNYRISDDWSVRSISAWRRTSRDTANDVAGIPFPGGKTTSSLHQTQYSQELVVNGDLTTKLHVLAGAFYFRETGDNQVTIFTNVTTFLGPPFFFDPLIFRGEDFKNTSKSVFANISYDILPNLTASAGFRYNQERKHVVLNSKFLVTGIPFAQGPEEFRDNVPLYDAKLTWQPTSDLLVYAKYGTGYRAGGIGFEASSGSTFKPETAETYEAGFKWDFRLGSMPARLNTAVFDSTYEDFQVPVVLTNPIRSTYTNAGEASIRGLELEFTIRPTTGLDLSASLGLLDAKYDSFKYTNLLLGGLADLTHNELRDAPKVQFSMSAGYTVPSAVGDWLFQADYAHQSSYETDTVYQTEAVGLAQTDVLRQGPTDNVNARVKLEKAFGSNVDISVWTKNLTDEKRLAYGLNAGVLLLGTYAEPLSYGIELHASF